MAGTKFKVYVQNGEQIMAVYTDLNDSKENEIYEGSILEYSTGYRAVVKIDSGSFITDSGHSSKFLYADLANNKPIVVGSIYENPKMLYKKGNPKYYKK